MQHICFTTPFYFPLEKKKLFHGYISCSKKKLLFSVRMRQLEAFLFAIFRALIHRDLFSFKKRTFYFHFCVTYTAIRMQNDICWKMLLTFYNFRLEILKKEY